MDFPEWMPQPNELEAKPMTQEDFDRIWNEVKQSARERGVFRYQRFRMTPELLCWRA